MRAAPHAGGRAVRGEALARLAERRGAQTAIIGTKKGQGDRRHARIPSRAACQEQSESGTADARQNGIYRKSHRFTAGGFCVLLVGHVMLIYEKKMGEQARSEEGSLILFLT